MLEGGSKKLVLMFKRTNVNVSILGYREGMILVEDLRGKVRIFSSLGGLMQVRSAVSFLLNPVIYCRFSQVVVWNI
jgi:hypothetical protein